MVLELVAWGPLAACELPPLLRCRYQRGSEMCEKLAASLHHLTTAEERELFDFGTKRGSEPAPLVLILDRCHSTSSCLHCTCCPLKFSAVPLLSVVNKGANAMYEFAVAETEGNNTTRRWLCHVWVDEHARHALACDRLRH